MIHLGLIGYPLGHSLSPKIHAAALLACGMRGDYTLFPVPPGDTQGLKDLPARVRSGELTGLNVTTPHKQNVIPLLDELTPTARAIGAVNTIYVKGDKLIGHNTDAQGFLTDLKRTVSISSFSPHPSALVLGAGGSARAVVSALLNEGWKVRIASRRTEQARGLASQFAIFDSRIAIVEYLPAALRSLFSSLLLIVNATPVGMFPATELSPWPAGLPFPEKAVVYDLVYNPCETLLVKQAKSAGLPAATGLGMLVEQAALAFEIWTGQAAPRGVMLQSVEEQCCDS
jgi:shikimate dehydrogenase